jgi:uncharacterized membrane protein
MAEAMPTRMEAVSDGVFSVALTLLLLEVRPKHLPFGDGVWWFEFVQNSGLFAASFFLVGIYWIAHKNECAYLTKTDRFWDWLNLVFVATIALLPFSVSVLAQTWHCSEAPLGPDCSAPGGPVATADITRAVALYLGNVTFCGVALSALFAYMMWQKMLNDDGCKNRWLTVSKNAALPISCALVWLCFTLTPQFARAYLIPLMASPPAIYLAMTIVIALYKKGERTRAP